MIANILLWGTYEEEKVLGLWVGYKKERLTIPNRVP